MNARTRRALLVAGGAFLGLATAGLLAGARVNTTRSIPVGLYWTSSKTPEQGDYVLICPPDVPVFQMAKERGYIGPGFCPGGMGYLMKKILAAKTEKIHTDLDGLWIQGDLVPNTAALRVDKAGRALPQYSLHDYQLKPSEVLVAGDSNPNSFDARYFGPLNRAQIQTVIVPIFTW